MAPPPDAAPLRTLDRSPRTPRAVLLLLAVVTACATFFLLGRTGHFNDDYFYNQRDVATGQIRALVLDRPYHVWRPLFKVIVPALHTLLWNHNWAMHLISTLAHGLVGWLLLRLLVRLGMSLRVSAAAAIVFLAWPTHYEAELWSCCLPTLLGSAMLLGMAHWHLSWVGRARPPRGVLALAPLAFGGAAFAIAALNEQPAGPLAALPLLGLLTPNSRSLPRPVVVRRSIVPCAIAGLALIGYIYGHFHHTGGFHKLGLDDADGPGPTFAARIAEQLRSILHEAPGQLALHGFGAGARQTGLESLRANPALTVGFGAALLAACVLAGRWWLRDADAPGGHAGPPPGADLTRRPGHLVFTLLFAAAWVVSAWVPIFVIHGVSTPRLHYVPDLGLAIALAAVLQLVRNSWARRGRATSGNVDAGWLRGVGFGLVLLVLGPSLLAMVGVQEGYRRRSERDLSETGALAALSADAVDPGTLFLPVLVESRIAETGSPLFDGYFLGTWNWDYGAGWMLQQSMRRTDVHTTLAGLDDPLGLYWLPGQERVNALLCAKLARPHPENKPPRNPEGKGRIMSWDRCVPFSVGRDGTVRVYTKVRLLGTADADGRPIEFTPTQVVRMQVRHPLPELVLGVERAPEELLHAKRLAPAKGPAPPQR